MDVREKAASISTALNVSLTVLKFVLYGATGSLAILAEAWHSSSDIATSALTYLAVRRTARQEKAESAGDSAGDAAAGVAPPEESKGDATEDRGGGATRSMPSAEQLASLAIGVIILAAGLTVIGKVISYQALPIARPLLAGVLFLIFAVGSYTVHRLEIDVGERTGSSGLIADGMHAKSDMIASLLTGVSLVLYHLGLDLDRVIGGLIGVLVLSVALETLVNLIVGYARGETRYAPHYRTHEILAKAFSLVWLAEAVHVVSRRVGVGGFTSAAVSRVRRWGVVVVVLLVVVNHARTCFFSVGLGQEAIVEHFGRPGRAQVGPGLHLKWPWPIDKAILIDRAAIQTSRVGNETDPQAFALIWTREHGTEIPFLSGDDNFFYPYLVVHWRIKPDGMFDAVYRQQAPGVLLDAVCHRVMSELCAKRGFYSLASTYRRALAEDIRTGAQKLLDELASGIEIVSVNLSDVHPPVFIADAFEDVVVARFQEQQQMVNEALGYRNERLPDTRGQAAREQAKAARYHSEQVSRAAGRGRAFELRREAIQSDETTRRIAFARIYYDNIAAALKGIGKILVDADAGRPDLWMGFQGPMGQSLSPDKARVLESLKERME
ncbi:MAG: protease modulator HflK family protein [Phycisphaerae bacterium]|nr:protease modulator HflK family protein [Phycisphaerae bacterium]